MELQSETILDLKAFNRLFGEYQQRFIRFAGTYVSDAATAEDIVMESFMAAWEKRDMLSASAFPPYALTIVKNKCLNHLRSQGVRRGYPLPRCAHAPNPHLDPRSLQPRGTVQRGGAAAGERDAGQTSGKDPRDLYPQPLRRQKL